MKHRILITLTLGLSLLAGTTVQAQKVMKASEIIKMEATKKNKKEAKELQSPDALQIHWKSMATDFGLIIQGEQVETTFSFTNKSEKPATIVDVMTSCGCTVPSYSKTPIKPGEVGSVKLLFNSTGRMGSFSKSAYVKLNDGTRHVLKIKGEIVQADKEKKADVIK